MESSHNSTERSRESTARGSSESRPGSRCACIDRKSPNSPHAELNPIMNRGRACDQCRHAKAKCRTLNGEVPTSSHCNRCAGLHQRCTRIGVAPKREKKKASKPPFPLVALINTFDHIEKSARPTIKDLFQIRDSQIMHIRQIVQEVATKHGMYPSSMVANPPQHKLTLDY